jgi:serine/threonine protein kinase
MAQETLLNNRYRLIAQHGSGGMAVVYKAQDVELGRVVAIKILRPTLTSDPAFLTRFRHEARAVANLAHPNIVTVHDVGHDRNTHYIVMEYIEGQDLKRLIRADAPFTINHALELTIQICAGVGYAHRADLVHADVKPQNVLVTEDGHVKVTDFGIARAFSYSAPGRKLSLVWGSPHYFSPEQAQGDPPTPAADVYAIGVILFEMLTGRLPFTGKDHEELALAHIQDEAPLVSDFNPSVPRNLSRIIRKVMAKEPSSRYRTADQLGRILINYREQGLDTTERQAASQATIAAPQQQASVTAPAATRQAQRQVSSSPVPPPRQPPSSAADFAAYYAPGQPAPPADSPGRSLKIDWMAVILVIVALLSVSGLMPLWAYVYHLWVVLR